MPALSRRDGHFRSELQAMHMWLPSASLVSHLGATPTHRLGIRSAVSVGTTSKRISTGGARRAGGNTQTMLFNSSRSPKRSKFHPAECQLLCY